MQLRPGGPNFLIIGAHRAGTTWLHRVLRTHSGLWLPPVKELHYFDKPTLKRTIEDATERRRVGLKGLSSLDPWYLNYWLGRRSDRWYASLFRKAQDKGFIVGEVTPAYATLDDRVFRNIRLVNEDIKLGFVMRDPVERAWSAVNNAYKKNRIEGELTVEKALARACSSGFKARSAYADTIKRLESVFPREQLYFCFFDDLRKVPESFVADLLIFLGVEPGNVRRLLPQGLVNSAAASKPVPFEFEREIAAANMPMIRELCDRFDGPPHEWRVRYEKLLKGAQVQ